MSVREANTLDAQALARIARENLGEGFSERDFKSSFNNPQMIILLYENKKETFGYLAASFAADEAELIQIAVDKETRRCGIGHRLMTQLIEILIKKDVKSIFLEVRESNDKAVSFYEGFGFKISGRRPGFYNNPKEDALLMRLDIYA